MNDKPITLYLNKDQKNLIHLAASISNKSIEDFILTIVLKSSCSIEEKLIKENINE